MNYYICEHCGNIVEKIHDSGVPVICCGQPMTLLVPGTVEAAHEKHIPVVTREGSRVHVEVGSVAHPMVPEHFIQWIDLETKNGVQRHFLKAGEEPKADFVLADGDDVVACYAYCNLHGLWKA